MTYLDRAAGQVDKVIINLSDYQKLVELLEDEGMYRAILEVKDEIPMSLSLYLTKVASSLDKHIAE
jgi:hypothetical protein